MQLESNDGDKTALDGDASSSHKYLNRRTVLLACAAVLLCVSIGGFAYYASLNAQLEAAESTAAAETPATDVDSSSSDSDGSEAIEEDLPQCPIDFEALLAENPDTIAWIYVPGTSVNYAIYQSSTDDLYYFDHAADGSYNKFGAIFTQSLNAKDFSDPVTVVYGHRSYGTGVMFSSLHDFEDATFFDENDTFYIYTPGHILTYRIVSAYQYDNRHILNSFDFSDSDTLQSYFDYVCNPDSLVKNVREGVELTQESKIVQLSTCMATNVESQRYIVTGYLVDDQRTAE